MPYKSDPNLLLHSQIIGVDRPQRAPFRLMKIVGDFDFVFVEFERTKGPHLACGEHLEHDPIALLQHLFFPWFFFDLLSELQLGGR